MVYACTSPNHVRAPLPRLHYQLQASPKTQVPFQPPAKLQPLAQHQPSAQQSSSNTTAPWSSHDLPQRHTNTRPPLLPNRTTTTCQAHLQVLALVARPQRYTPTFTLTLPYRHYTQFCLTNTPTTQLLPTATHTTYIKRVPSPPNKPTTQSARTCAPHSMLPPCSRLQHHNKLRHGPLNTPPTRPPTKSTHPHKDKPNPLHKILPSTPHTVDTSRPHTDQKISIHTLHYS